MFSKRAMIRIAFITSVFLTLILALNVPTIWGETTAAETPSWEKDIRARCTSPGDCEVSSPALIDLTGDDILDIVLATSNGWVMAYKNSGQLLWEKDIASAFGMSGSTQQINSSPAIADIDNDGKLEIVVGTGTTSTSTCTQGGVIVLENNGNSATVQSGWPFFTHDGPIPPSGCTDTVFSTPALGDLDNDGDMEVVVGSFDKRIYVLHHDGTLDSNFPIDSAHIVRFPDWDGLQGKLADTIWSSPALADMDGDGYLDIIIGTDEGNFGSSYGAWPDNWECSFSTPTLDYCGGALYVIDRHGENLPGFPKRIHETIQSSPAIYDIDQDGLPEIFVGAGTYYYTVSPEQPTMDFRIYGWDNEGNDLPGWEGGQVTGGSTPASPAIGDIAGDGTAEVVALSMDKKLYAWNAAGSAVSGFPMTPRDQTENGYTYDVGRSLVLGDYDGDNKMEIFMTTGWSITVVDGNGTQYTTTTNPPNNTFFFAEATLKNNPAVGDIDNDGKLELVAHNGTLFAWDLPNAGSEADWPMFRQNAARTGTVERPSMQITPLNLTALHPISDGNDILFTVNLKNPGKEPIAWTAVRNGTNITLSSSGGTLVDVATVLVNVERSSLVAGENVVGNITITGTVDGVNVVNSPTLIPITVFLVNEVNEVFLPAVVR